MLDFCSLFSIRWQKILSASTNIKAYKFLNAKSESNAKDIFALYTNL